MRHLRPIGAFWYDFLVGDRPELFIGPIVVLAVTWGFLQAGVPAGMAGLIVVVGIVAIGFTALRIALRPRSRPK